MLATTATSTLTAATVGSRHDGIGFAVPLLSGNFEATVHTLTHAATGALIVTVCIVVYLLTCWAWPFGKCRRCKGAGTFTSSFGNTYRHCGTCDGSGLRVRLGRHVINHIRTTRAAGTTTTSKGNKK